MNDQTFTTASSVEHNPHGAFDAITNVRGWWSTEIKDGTKKRGHEVACHYRDIHYSKMRLIEVVTEKRVLWQALNNRLNFVEDQPEWKGTEVWFEISLAGRKAEPHFHHRGLVPEYERFDSCPNAGGSYIDGGLRKLITSGRGQPNLKETGMRRVHALLENRP